MNKYLLTLLAIILFSYCESQESASHVLDTIQTEADAFKYLQSSSASSGKVIVFNTEKHNSKLANDLYDTKLGGKRVYENEFRRTHYKVLKRNFITHYRMNYIVLKNELLSADEMTNLPAKIKHMHKAGHNFLDLASRFSMDDGAHKGGDSGWFSDDDFHPEIIELLRTQKDENELLEIVIKPQNVTYLIVSTYSPKKIEEVTVLKYTEEIQ